jgi:DNA-binding Lrp family transcriptional regulator
MLETEKVRLSDWYKQVREVTKQLDRTNVKIISAMWKSGPRNLLEVSRRTRIPFTSVYHRVAKLEAKSERIAYLVPQISKIGLMRAVVLVTAEPGAEERVTAALKIPNMWCSVTRCEGMFTHHSIQAIPVKALKDFKAYMKRLHALKLVTEYKIILTGEYIPNFPNLTYYNADSNQWTFEWGDWFKEMRKKPKSRLDDPEDYSLLVGKKDLLIVNELEKNARISFADLAPLLGISLQGVKYHYDKKLVPAGIVKHFGFHIVAFPLEVSAHHEVLLKFRNEAAMNKFYSSIGSLFFVIGVAKVLRQNALIVRTYILQSQLQNMFTFLSRMATEGYLESYSTVRLDLTTKEKRPVSYDLFDEEKGWQFDLKKPVSELRHLARMARVRQRNVVPRAGVS